MSINWVKISRKEISPPAIPNLRGQGDRTNFDIVHDAPSKFDMFSDDIEDEECPPKPDPKWNAADKKTAPAALDLSVFNDWPTTVYL